MLHGRSVKPVEDAFLGALDGSCSWSIVHKGQLTEKFSSLVGLKISLLAVDDLGAVVLAPTDNVQSLSFLALLDDLLPRFEVLNGHGIDDDIHVLVRQGVEDDRLGEQSSDYLFDLHRFLDHLWHKLLFFVECPIHFGADSLPAQLLLVLLLFQFLLKFPISFLLIFLSTAFGVGGCLLFFSFV